VPAVFGSIPLSAQVTLPRRTNDCARRSPQGFVCPECGHTAHCALKSRRLFQCNGCGRQTSVTAGTPSCRFVAAVEVDAAGRPRRMNFNRVKGFRS
jgi:ribosomal protein L37AE/L43A